MSLLCTKPFHGFPIIIQPKKSLPLAHKVMDNDPFLLLSWFHLCSSFYLFLHSWSIGLLLFLNSLSVTFFLPSPGGNWLFFTPLFCLQCTQIPFNLHVLLLIALITYYHATKYTFHIYCLLSVWFCWNVNSKQEHYFCCSWVYLGACISAWPTEKVGIRHGPAIQGRVHLKWLI